MRRRKGDSIASGNAHKKLAKTLILARAERALQDSDDLERQATALVEQLRNARIGETLRKHGENSRGRPRKATTDDLRAAVLEMHEHSPHLTKTQVVERVRKRFNYKDSRPVEDVCRLSPAIKAWRVSRKSQK
jgi:hypothetical protein